ncbi:MAG: flagellar biosynthesis anti-sigma factor FlgM [Gorillibacterium sp.]|nr:flagellar biosynthesis anti-sigma factor FlgM [Gorillibacterium sp.]
MKINEPSRISSINPYTKQQDSKLARQDTGKVKQKDNVQISPEAKELQELLAASANHPTDEARVQELQELKQQVSTGTYHVDAGKIAEKLLPYLK